MFNLTRVFKFHKIARVANDENKFRMGKILFYKSMRKPGVTVEAMICEAIRTNFHGNKLKIKRQKTAKIYK